MVVMAIARLVVLACHMDKYLRLPPACKPNIIKRWHKQLSNKYPYSLRFALVVPEQDHAARGRLGCSHQEAMVAACVETCDGGRREAADAIGLEPFTLAGKIEVLADGLVKFAHVLDRGRRAYQGVGCGPGGPTHQSSMFKW